MKYFLLLVLFGCNKYSQHASVEEPQLNENILEVNTFKELKTLDDGKNLYNSFSNSIIPVIYCARDYDSLEQCEKIGVDVLKEWISRVNQWASKNLNKKIRVSSTFGVFMANEYLTWADDARNIFSDPTINLRSTASKRNVVMIFKIVKDINRVTSSNEQATFQEGGGGNVMNCTLRADVGSERFLYQYRFNGTPLARLDTACFHGLGHSLYVNDPSPLIGLPHPGTRAGGPCDTSDKAPLRECLTVNTGQQFTSTRGAQNLMLYAWASTNLIDKNEFGDYLDFLNYEKELYLKSPLFESY